MVSMPRQMTAMFSAQENFEHGKNGLPADPGLYAKPSASNQGTEHGGNVGAAHAERGPDENRKGNAVLCPRVGVKQHGDEHDEVAEQNGAYGLPPAHAACDQSTGQHVGRNAHRHRDPEGRVIVEAPGALLRRDGRQIFVVQRGVVLLHYFQAPPRAVRLR